MTFRLAAMFVFPCLLVGASQAAAADEIEPLPGVVLSGAVQFPREQAMTIETDPRDGSKLTLRMAFDGRCKGGGIGEVWASRVEAQPTVRVRKGRFSAEIAGTARDLGGVKGRTGRFTWRLSGRFTGRDVAVATVTGSANIVVGRKVVSRCKIAAPADVRLAIRSSR